MQRPPERQSQPVGAAHLVAAPSGSPAARRVASRCARPNPTVDDVLPGVLQLHGRKPLERTLGGTVEQDSPSALRTGPAISRSCHGRPQTSAPNDALLDLALGRSRRCRLLAISLADGDTQSRPSGKERCTKPRNSNILPIS